MKVEVKESSKKAERPFPKLMIHANGVTVVLFTTKTEGIIMQSEDKLNPVGYYWTCFGSDAFEDFEGSITLSND